MVAIVSVVDLLVGFGRASVFDRGQDWLMTLMHVYDERRAPRYAVGQTTVQKIE